VEGFSFGHLNPTSLCFCPNAKQLPAHPARGFEECIFGENASGGYRFRYFAVERSVQSKANVVISEWTQAMQFLAFYNTVLSQSVVKPFAVMISSIVSSEHNQLNQAVARYSDNCLSQH